ncbi:MULTISPECIES: hypothetical protein [Acidianus]|uniref:Peptide ABC transporter permease n=1 Tax=Candidatus Acidianus copahuensis TaxID=1160895 RepID=A0A031LTK8_9CREN|nr:MULTISPECIES: hypothetical protein [Acidianus]EZQ11126.1 peptide ABC transporter permease [Candidatus Acidianus copahuensis]NON62751.1 peptide ABC transporter permease [Acidianus sp. RZ1]
MPKSMIFFIIFIILSIFFYFFILPSGKPLQPPSLEYPLGTYLNGNNMINTNADAIVNTLIFGFIVGIIETTLALSFGYFSGISKRNIEIFMARVMDGVTALPRIPLLLAIALIYGTPTGNSLISNFFFVILIVALTGWSNYARQVSKTISENKIITISKELLPKFPFYLSLSLSSTSLKIFGKKIIIPAMVDGISTYTAMGVIAGVGDPSFPTLTTLLTTSSKLLPDWWLFLIPALLRAVLVVSLLYIADKVK